MNKPYSDLMIGIGLFFISLPHISLHNVGTNLSH